MPTYFQNYFYTPSVKSKVREVLFWIIQTYLGGASERFISECSHSVWWIKQQWTSTALPALSPSTNQPCSCMHGLFLSGWGRFLELRRSSASAHQGIGPKTLTHIGWRVAAAWSTSLSKCFGHVLLACKSWVTETCSPQPVTLFRFVPNNYFRPIVLHR